MINRRRLASCYSWPGVDAVHCLDRYEIQLEPFIRILLGIEGLSKHTSPYYRALNRASFEVFNNDMLNAKRNSL